MRRHTRTATVATTKRHPIEVIGFGFLAEQLPLTAYLTHTLQYRVEWSVIIMKNDRVWRLSG